MLWYCLSSSIACKLKKLQYPIFPSSPPHKGRKISKWYCDGVIGVSWGIIPVCTNALCSAANMIIMFHEASRGGDGDGGWRIREGRWEWGGICSLGRKMCARNFTCQPAGHIATTTIAQVFCCWCLVLFLWLPSFLLTDCQLFETRAVKPKSGNGQFCRFQWNEENQQKSSWCKYSLNVETSLASKLNLLTLSS